MTGSSHPTQEQAVVRAECSATSGLVICRRRALPRMLHRADRRILWNLCTGKGPRPGAIPLVTAEYSGVQRSTAGRHNAGVTELSAVIADERLWLRAALRPVVSRDRSGRPVTLRHPTSIRPHLQRCTAAAWTYRKLDRARTLRPIPSLCAHDRVVHRCCRWTPHPSRSSTRLRSLYLLKTSHVGCCKHHDPDRYRAPSVASLSRSIAEDFSGSRWCMHVCIETASISAMQLITQPLVNDRCRGL